MPIIKFQEVVSGLAFDVSFNAANGPQAAKYVRDLMQQLPPMRSLILVLKVFLHQRELNEVGMRYVEGMFSSLKALHSVVGSPGIRGSRCCRTVAAGAVQMSHTTVLQLLAVKVQSRRGMLCSHWCHHALLLARLAHCSQAGNAPTAAQSGPPFRKSIGMYSPPMQAVNCKMQHEDP